MKEEDIQKVLSGEVAVSALTNAEFIELVKALERVYCARVMNCVDGTGKSDKEWIALSNIFNRMGGILSSPEETKKLTESKGE